MEEQNWEVVGSPVFAVIKQTISKIWASVLVGEIYRDIYACKVV